MFNCMHMQQINSFRCETSNVLLDLNAFVIFAPGDNFQIKAIVKFLPNLFYLSLI